MSAERDDGPDGGREVEQPPQRDVDAAWAEIVARWEGEPPRPDEDDGPAPALPAHRDPAHREPPATPLPDDRPAPGPRDHELAEADESFVPPVAPPLGRVRPSAWLPWAGVLGGPLLLVVAALLYPAVPAVLLVLSVAAFCAGAALVVLRLPARRRDDGDDGAVV